MNKDYERRAGLADSLWSNRRQLTIQGSASKDSAEGRNADCRFKHLDMNLTPTGVHSNGKGNGGGSSATAIWYMMDLCEGEHFLPVKGRSVTDHWLSNIDQGGFPVHRWSRTQPAAHISAGVLLETPSPRIISGAMYIGVPNGSANSEPVLPKLDMLFREYILRRIADEAVPKSANLSVPSSLSRTLPGLMSRWAMPFICKYASASNIYRASSTYVEQNDQAEQTCIAYI